MAEYWTPALLLLIFGAQGLWCLWVGYGLGRSDEARDREERE